VGIRSLRRRPGSVAAIGSAFAGVVVILVGFYSLQNGLRGVMLSSGRADVAIVRRLGGMGASEGMLDSQVRRQAAQSPLVRRIADSPMLSEENVAVAGVHDNKTNAFYNVRLRGVSLQAAQMRSGFRVVRGRMFLADQFEIILGSRLARRLPGVALGDTLTILNRPWRVVGIFESSGDVRESEVWAHTTMVQSLFNSNGSYQLLFAALVSPDAFAAFAKEIEQSAPYPVEAIRESDYFGEQARLFTAFLEIVAPFVAALVLAGAALSSMATWHSILQSRLSEVAVYQALGYGRAVVMGSILLEGLVLGALGGFSGALIALAVFAGQSSETIAGFSTTFFQFDVSLSLLTVALASALALGLVAAVAPALLVARRDARELLTSE
jgi:putative ABC transport system permease protein